MILKMVLCTRKMQNKLRETLNWVCDHLVQMVLDVVEENVRDVYGDGVCDCDCVCVCVFDFALDCGGNVGGSGDNGCGDYLVGVVEAVTEATNVNGEHLSQSAGDGWNDDGYVGVVVSKDDRYREHRRGGEGDTGAGAGVGVGAYGGDGAMVEEREDHDDDGENEDAVGVLGEWNSH